MTRHSTRLDQALSTAIGLAFLALVFVGPKTPLGYLGIIPLVTGLFAICPLYALVGVSSARKAADGAVVTHR